MSNTRRTSWLGSRPENQGPRSQSRNRSPDKLATWEDEGREDQDGEGGNNNRHVAGQNFKESRKTRITEKRYGNYRCDILGLAEVRWMGTGETNGQELIWSGKEVEHAYGVIFWLSKREKKALINYHPMNSRIIARNSKGIPMDFTVIPVNAPAAVGLVE